MTKINKQTLFAVITITLVTLVATTLQAVYACSVYVDLSQSAFGMRLVTVEITGPFGYSDRRTVSTGPNATVNFTIPDSEIPYGYQYRVCTHSEGSLGILLPNCDYFTRGSEPWMWIGMPVPYSLSL